jgi:N-acetylneuraminate synthase/N,N'-diacetyllegionaminate synthase
VQAFSREFSIAGRRVGGDAPVFFIAEAGVAHFGDMKLARQLVDLAASAKADGFKIQVFDVDTLFAATLPEWRERLRPRNLTLDEVRQVQRWCEDAGLIFFATAHDESRIGWLRDCDMPVVKVGSGERGNPDFLRKLAALGKPMIVSTGMYTREDVAEALQACLDGGCRDVALLHCVTSYPTPDENVNLRAMDVLQEMFPGPVGYSDHTPDEMAVLAAVARGAKVIEKHITILRDVPNAQDWKVSAGPENLAKLIADIRRIEQQLGERDKQPTAGEREAERWATKSLVAARRLPAGHQLADADIAVKRPGTGIAPSKKATVIGRRLKQALDADALILPEHLA